MEEAAAARLFTEAELLGCKHDPVLRAELEAAGSGLTAVELVEATAAVDGFVERVCEEQFLRE